LVEAVMAHRGGAVMLGVTTGFTTREEWMRQSDAHGAQEVLSDLRDLLKLPGMARHATPGALVQA
jgi:phosphoglycolate phosphatase-like HAD superfamily hydrolase